jgi:hypothetical protein
MIMWHLFVFLLALLIIWAIGFILVRLFADRHFKDLHEQLAVSILLGICVISVVPIIPLFFIREGSFYLLFLRWMGPVLLLLLILGLALQPKSRALLQRASYNSWRLAGSARHFSFSAIFLICGLFLLYALPRSEAVAIAFSGSTLQGQAMLSVTTSSVTPQVFTLRIIPEDSQEAFFVPLAPISQDSGPIQASFPIKGKLRCELFYTASLTTASLPLRWIELQAEE